MDQINYNESLKSKTHLIQTEEDSSQWNRQMSKSKLEQMITITKNAPFKNSIKEETFEEQSLFYSNSRQGEIITKRDCQQQQQIYQQKLYKTFERAISQEIYQRSILEKQKFSSLKALKIKEASIKISQQKAKSFNFKASELNKRMKAHTQYLNDSAIKKREELQNNISLSNGQRLNFEYQRTIEQAQKREFKQQIYLKRMADQSNQREFVNQQRIVQKGEKSQRFYNQLNQDRQELKSQSEEKSAFLQQKRVEVQYKSQLQQENILQLYMQNNENDLERLTEYQRNKQKDNMKKIIEHRSKEKKFIRQHKDIENEYFLRQQNIEERIQKNSIKGPKSPSKSPMRQTHRKIVNNINNNINLTDSSISRINSIDQKTPKQKQINQLMSSRLELIRLRENFNQDYNSFFITIDNNQISQKLQQYKLDQVPKIVDFLIQQKQ